MEWRDIEQRWPQYRAQVQRHWSELSEDDLTAIAGSRDRLMERLQQVYGMTREQAQQAVEEFARATRPLEPAREARGLLFNDEIRGVKVIAADGRGVGEVGDLLVDSASWQVQAIEIKLDKEMADELGVPRGRFHAATVSLPVRMIQSVGDHVILTVAAAGLGPTLRARREAA